MRKTLFVLSVMATALLLASRVALAAAGDPDSTFGGDGRVLADLGGYDWAEALARQRDGKLVAAGFTATPKLGSSVPFAL